MCRIIQRDKNIAETFRRQNSSDCERKSKGGYRIKRLNLLKFPFALES